MSGDEYRRRCMALGYKRAALAKILGLSERALRVRWQSGSEVRRECVFALHSLESISLGRKYIIAMDAHNPMPKPEPCERELRLTT